MTLLVLITPLAALFLLPALLREGWLYAYVVIVVPALAILLDSSGRNPSNCGFCDAMADAYYMYLAFVGIVGLLARSVVGMLRIWGLAWPFVWIPVPVGLVLVIAAPLALFA